MEWEGVPARRWDYLSKTWWLAVAASFAAALGFCVLAFVMRAYWPYDVGIGWFFVAFLSGAPAQLYEYRERRAREEAVGIPAYESWANRRGPAIAIGRIGLGVMVFLMVAAVVARYGLSRR